MRERRNGVTALIAKVTPRNVAAGDWQAWIRLPRRLAARVAAIDRVAGTLTVGYPRRPDKRPAARTAPCRLLDAARLPVATLRRLQALERSNHRRYVLVAYRLAPLPESNRR